MKLLAGLATGNSLDPVTLQKLLGSMGNAKNSFDPSMLKDLMAMAGRLESQRDTLEKAFPEMDWSRFSELIAKFRTNPSPNDSVELMKFLEQLRHGVGPLGQQDISSLGSLLEKFRNQQPNPATFPSPERIPRETRSESRANSAGFRLAESHPCSGVERQLG
jgi:hypothetical protein